MAKKRFKKVVSWSSDEEDIRIGFVILAVFIFVTSIYHISQSNPWGIFGLVLAVVIPCIVIRREVVWEEQ